MEYIKSAIIIVAFILYWTFIYYRFHEHDFTPISIMAAGAFLIFLGGYGFFTGNVAASDVKIIYMAGLFFLASSYVLVGLGTKKYGLKKEIDITLTFLNRLGGKWCVVVLSSLAFPLFFFMMAGSYRLLGPEHICGWGMIFLAWTASGIKLAKRIRKK
jgi:hypothetical protein